MEVECTELISDWIRRVYFGNRSVNLQVVVVHDDAQVIQLTESCKHRSLPYLAFLDFTITKQGIYAIRLIGKLCGKSHSCCDRNALSQWSWGSINTRCMGNAWMSLKVRTYVTQSLQVLYREKSAVCQCRVQTRCSMSLGQYETVSVCLLRILRVDIHLFKVQIGKNLCCGKWSARMTGLCSMNTFDDSLTNLNCFFLQFQICHLCSLSSLLILHLAKRVSLLRRHYSTLVWQNTFHFLPTL